MNQNSYQAITAMLNAFPQSAGGVKALLLTYEKALTGLSDQAVNEAATRFIQGDVDGQNKRFAPSVAEFVGEARKRQEFIEIRNRPRIAGNSARQEFDPNWKPPTPEEKARVAKLVADFKAGLPLKERSAGFDWTRVHMRFDSFDSERVTDDT